MYTEPIIITVYNSYSFPENDNEQQPEPWLSLSWL